MHLLRPHHGEGLQHVLAPEQLRPVEPVQEPERLEPAQVRDLDQGAVSVGGGREAVEVEAEEERKQGVAAAELGHFEASVGVLCGPAGEVDAPPRARSGRWARPGRPALVLADPAEPVTRAGPPAEGGPVAVPVPTVPDVPVSFSHPQSTPRQGARREGMGFKGSVGGDGRKWSGERYEDVSPNCLGRMSKVSKWRDP